MTTRVRIAHLAGPNATIQNSPPLVTSNKARAKYGLPLLSNSDNSPMRFDVLRPQRIAASAKVYVEQFGAHPLERDAAELYGPPDGYLDANGKFSKERRGPDGTPVFEIEIRPEDGVYPLPYMARQADGRAWEDDGTDPLAPVDRMRQSFYPDGSRPFEEIDRLSIGEHGTGNLISSIADIDFYRVLPPSGYSKGLAGTQRTDMGSGDIPPETRGKDYFPYRPPRLGTSPPRPALARITNAAQQILASGKYQGAIWTQGSPRIEETIYWFNLLLDTTLPVCGNAAQRTHGQISNDGPKNIVDSVEYITSRVWADETGRNRAGMVLIQEQQVFAARDVQKGDARPGGFVTTGGHGGILGAAGIEGSAPVLNYLPATRHTYRSEVNISRLPHEVRGVRLSDTGIVQILVQVKNIEGELLDTAIPKVSIVKDGNYMAEDYTVDVEKEVDLLALIDANLRTAPLAGFVVEGLAPYGTPTVNARHLLMMRAVHCGMPVVRVGRGNNEGFTPGRDRFIGGRNLTSTKARILLMACLMRLGTLPPAADPDRPTKADLAAILEKIAAYQEIFNTH